MSNEAPETVSDAAPDPRVRSLVACLELQTRLLDNCFRGVPRESALERPGGQVNNMVFLAAHLVDARRYLANLLGPEVDNPFPQLGEGESIDDFPELPPTDEILAAWNSLGGVVRERLESASADLLEGRPPHPFPVSDPTVLGAVAFLVTHETYHVGQLALLRRLLGHGAMSYE